MFAAIGGYSGFVRGGEPQWVVATQVTPEASQALTEAAMALSQNSDESPSENVEARAPQTSSVKRHLTEAG